MGDRHDYVALEWVKGEIAETLKQAHHAIETLLDDPQATHALSDCLACIHQVHGSLQMVEFYGAALLAEEMEQLVCAMQQDRVSHRDEALHLLMQALGQLPIYLDRVQGARRDLPLVVLPLINDLRSARGEGLLSETSLFSPQLPDLPPLDEESLALLEPAELPSVLRKLRQMLQMALVGLLREQDDEANLGYLAKVFSRLESLCGNAPLSPLWQVASALVDCQQPRLAQPVQGRRQRTQAPARTGHARDQSTGAAGAAQEFAVLHCQSRTPHRADADHERSLRTGRCAA